MLDLYTWNTHNGHKGRIAVEESGLPYNLHAVNLPAGENRKSDYAALSGHRRIPVLVDSEGPDGRPITLMESGVILVYLAKKTGSSMYPTALRDQLEVDQWSMHGQATFGPGISPHRHLQTHVPGDNEGAKEFFKGRAERLYETLDLRLRDRPYIALDRYTVADVSHFVVVHSYDEQKIDLDLYPNIKRWYEAIWARPAVKKGVERVG